MSSGDLGSVRRRSVAQTAAGERGSVVFIVAAWLTLMLVIGMSVDYGIVVRYRRAMQNAATRPRWRAPPISSPIRRRRPAWRSATRRRT
jgi:hypothetical protein